MEKIKAKKSLGQNFLKDETILKKIATSFSVTKDDLIIEIGPGMGALTKYFIQMPSHLLCYEIDTRLKDILIPFDNEQCQIIFDDFLKRDLKSDISKTYQHIYVIANIPYYITTPIIEHILDSEIKITGMTLLVQKEVAQRFVAKPKTKDYGYFTVYLNHFFDVSLLFDVPRTAFDPSPKVTSSVVQMRSKETKFIDHRKFQVFLKQAFGKKRKILKNNFNDQEWQKIVVILQKLGYEQNVRAEEISYEDFVFLFQQFQSENIVN